MDLIIEGFSSLRFGCTMALAILGLAPVLSGRRYAPAMAIGFWLTAGVSGWIRFTGIGPNPPGDALSVVVGVALAALAIWAVVRPTWPTAALATVYSALISGWLWVPCVGKHLSGPLNDAPTDRLGTIGPILLYVLGVSAPLLALAAVPMVSPRGLSIRDSKSIGIGAAVIGSVLGLVVAVGWYSDFVHRFTG